MQNRKPMVLVLAGPNGSGKNTITTFFEKVGKYTNADDIVASTGEYYGAAEPPVRCGESHLSGLTEPLRSL